MPAGVPFFLSPAPLSIFGRDPGDPRRRLSHKAARRPRDGPCLFLAAPSFALRVASLSGGCERVCSAGSTWLMATLNEPQSMREGCVIERLAPRDAALRRQRLLAAPMCLRRSRTRVARARRPHRRRTGESLQESLQESPRSDFRRSKKRFVAHDAESLTLRFEAPVRRRCAPARMQRRGHGHETLRVKFGHSRTPQRLRRAREPTIITVR